MKSYRSGATLPAGATISTEASPLPQASSSVLFHRYRRKDWRMDKYWYALGTSFLIEACRAYPVLSETYQAELEHFKKKWRTPS